MNNPKLTLDHVDEKNTDAMERAKRVKLLRSMTGLSRIEFANQFGIHYETLKGWETARHGGLSNKGAKSLVEIVSNANIITTYDWLMFGIGQLPQFSSDLESKEKQINIIKASGDNIREETNFFKNLYPNAIIYHLIDDSMAPQYNISEYVIAVPIDLEKEAHNAIHKDCLIQLDSGLLVFRRLHSIQKNNIATIYCLNQETHANNVWLQNMSVKLVAPIIWHKKII